MKENGNMLMLKQFMQLPYDVPVIGNDTVNTNTLRLWSAEPSEDSQVIMIPKIY